MNSGTKYSFPHNFFFKSIIPGASSFCQILTIPGQNSCPEMENKPYMTVDKTLTIDVRTLR